jgi:hypothetical protein
LGDQFGVELICLGNLIEHMLKFFLWHETRDLDVCDLNLREDYSRLTGGDQLDGSQKWLWTTYIVRQIVLLL